MIYVRWLIIETEMLELLNIFATALTQTLSDTVWYTNKKDEQ